MLLPKFVKAGLSLSVALLCSMSFDAFAEPAETSTADVEVRVEVAPETRLMGFFSYEIRKVSLTGEESVSRKATDSGWIAFTADPEDMKSGQHVRLDQLTGLTVPTGQSIPFEVRLKLEPRKHKGIAFNVELNGMSANGTLVGVAVVDSPNEVTLKLHGNEDDATVIKLTRVSGRQPTQTGKQSVARPVIEAAYPAKKPSPSKSGTFDQNSTPFYPEG